MLEFVERGAGELAPRQQVEPAQEGSAGIFALEVVGGVEQPLPARLALAARKRPQTVQSPCDRAGEAQLALAVRGHRPEQRRGCLMGAMGAAETLNRAGGPPPGLSQERTGRPPGRERGWKS